MLFRSAITITVGGNREENEEFAPTTTQQASYVQPQQAPVQATVSQPAPQQVAPAQAPQAPVDAIPEPTVRSTSKPVQEAPSKIDLGDVSLDDLVGDWA